MDRIACVALAAALLAACKDKATTDSGTPSTDTGAAAETYPTLYCPGDPGGGCDDNDGALSVGAAKVDITPTCYEDWVDLDDDFEWDYEDEEFRDCGCDRLCSDDDGYPGPDEGEEDGEFQAVWLAGFHNARPMTHVLDDIWARAIVFDQGSTRVAVVEVDVVGFFRPDIVPIREALAASGADIDHLLVASTHNHEAPDTMGLWGKTESKSGVDPDFIAQIQAAVQTAVTDAIADLRPVGTMKVGAVDVGTYHENGVYNVITDLRDPVVIDEIMGGAAFWDTDGQVIATLAHFGDHPESLADENTGLTSDFPHSMRETMESGVTWDSHTREGLGGVAIFVNGAVGGMMTGLRVDVEDPDGNVWDAYTYERTVVMGKLMGEMALDAIEGGDTVDDPALRLVVAPLKLRVENWGFQALFLSGIIDRALFDYDETQPLDDDNVPSIEAELNLIRIGPLQLLTVPGELHPELNIGGYDGSHVGSDSAVVIDPDNPNPPDLSQAPEGPYIKERVAGDGALEHVWLVGMGNDEIGYIMPEFNFELDAVNPWFDEAEGDHYEETNSLGPETAASYEAAVDTLLSWTAENQP